MPHHGSEMPEYLRKKIIASLDEINPVLGATGKYPQGKINEHDEGELQFAVAVDPNSKTVIINFGKPTAWIGFDRATALSLAQLLVEKANEL